MSESLLLDEHFSQSIAQRLRAAGHDVRAVVADPELRAQPDAELYRRAAAWRLRIVTENVKDFRPLLQQAYADNMPVARLLLVAPHRFPRGAGRRAVAVVRALTEWLVAAQTAARPDEDWLV